jgi:hypothetical protein
VNIIEKSLLRSVIRSCGEALLVTAESVVGIILFGGMTMLFVLIIASVVSPLVYGGYMLYTGEYSVGSISLLIGLAFFVVHSLIREVCKRQGWTSPYGEDYPLSLLPK